MSATALTGIVLTQLDKVILSRLLSLNAFGYYAIAGLAASLPGALAGAFYNAVYPRLNQLAVIGDYEELRRVYHRSCQLLAVMLAPVGLVVAVFSKELMFLWTRSPVTTANTYRVVSILAVGQLFTGFMILPYAMQLAHGWTRLGWVSNVVAIVLLVPTIIWLASTYGVVGASCVWVLLYGGQMVGMIHWMHGRLLVDEKRRWYTDDVFRPFAASLVVIVLGRFVRTDEWSSAVVAAYLASVLVVAWGCAAMGTPLARAWILGRPEIGKLLGRWTTC